MNIIHIYLIYLSQLLDIHELGCKIKNKRDEIQCTAVHLFTVVAMNCCSGDEKASQDTLNAIAEEIVALFGLNGLDYRLVPDALSQFKLSCYQKLAYNSQNSYRCIFWNSKLNHVSGLSDVTLSWKHCTPVLVPFSPIIVYSQPPPRRRRHRPLRRARRHGHHFPLEPLHKEQMTGGGAFQETHQFLRCAVSGEFCVKTELKVKTPQVGNRSGKVRLLLGEDSELLKRP